jgi:tetratricopeptide (TPR) repeat protein
MVDIWQSAAGFVDNIGDDIGNEGIAKPIARWLFGKSLRIKTYKAYQSACKRFFEEHGIKPAAQPNHFLNFPEVKFKIEYTIITKMVVPGAEEIYAVIEAVVRHAKPEGTPLPDRTEVGDFFRIFRDKFKEVSKGEDVDFQKLVLKGPEEGTPTVASLLKWNNRLTGMKGRDEEMQALEDWVRKPLKISIGLLSGEGGTGKSRLAIETAEMFRQEGHDAGRPSSYGDNDISVIARGKSEAFVIIDYAEEHLEQVRELLAVLRKLQEEGNMGISLRVLLVSRNDEDFWRNELVNARMSESLGLSIPLAGIAGDNAPYEIFLNAWEEGKRRLPKLIKNKKKDEKAEEKPPQVDQVPSMQEFTDWYNQDPLLHSRPLFIIAYALELVENPLAKGLGAAAIITKIAEREIQRLHDLSLQAEMSETGLLRLAALAAVSGGLTERAVRNFVKDNEKLMLDINMTETGVGHFFSSETATVDGVIPAPKPDILAAELVDNALSKGHGKEGKWLWAAIESAESLAGAISALSRLTHDASYVLEKKGWEKHLSLLAKKVRGNVERCRKLAPVFQSNAWRAKNLWQVEEAVYVELAEEAGARGAEGEKAGHLNNLGILHADRGAFDAAEREFGEALEIYRKLAAADPGAYRPDVAMTLNNLGILHADRGAFDAAEREFGEALEIRRKLAETDPGAYEPLLAHTEKNLGMLLIISGRKDTACKTLTEALSHITPHAHKSPTYQSWKEDIEILLKECGD